MFEPETKHSVDTSLRRPTSYPTSPGPTATFSPTTDRGTTFYALQQLYWAAGGQHWRKKQSWLEGDPCARDSEWHGVKCHRSNTVMIVKPLDRNNIMLF